MRTHRAGQRFPTGLWLGSLVAILAVAVAGIAVSRATGHAPSPIAARLAAAVIVTACVAIAKAAAGPRAAAVAGVVGTALAVVVLIALG